MTNHHLLISRRKSLVIGGAALVPLALRGTAAQEKAKAKEEPTKFQIACMTLPYSQYPLARALSGIKSAGFEYVALYTSHKEAGEAKTVPVMPPDGPLSRAKEIGQRCRDAGLKPLLMFSGIYPEDAKGVEVLTQRIQQAQAAGVGQVLTFGHTSGNNRKIWIERFKQLGAVARDHGVVLVAKQHGETGQVTGEIVREVDHPAVKVNYDAGNVMDYTKGQVNPLDDIKTCAELIHSFCIKDHRMFPVNQDCGPGFGEIDHYRLLANVSQTGREMPLCCENISAPKMRATTPEEIDVLARRAREFLEVVVHGLLAALVFGLMLGVRSLQAEEKTRAAALDPAFRIVQDAVANENIPGAIALVAKDGKIIREEAFGLSDVENKRPMTPTTLCWIASITKPVTVAATMKLVERGQLSLDDPVERYLPEFAEQKDREGRHHAIKLRHLMSHTSGIQPNPPTRPSLFFEAGWMGRKIGEVPPLIARTTLEFPPGSQVHYSNAAPYVLARIVELRSGEAFHEFVQGAIFDPAGMKDTYFIVPPSEAGRVAVVYRDNRDKNNRDKNNREERTEFCRWDPTWKVTMTMPDGGLFSCPREIAKFLQLFLDDEGLLDDGGRVLAQETVRAMRTREAAGWGLGWALEEDGLFHHFGSSGTSAWAEAQSGVVGVLFFQLQNQNKIDSIQARFRDAVRGALAAK
jgi:CubicO group peptidase (beta-lactamase class C family)/sugar phosphate isomerase/epimerase